MNDFLDRINVLIAQAVPVGYRVKEQTADWSPAPRLITYRASLIGASTGTNPRLGSMTLDVDVWAQGPDTGVANTIADQVCEALETSVIGPSEGELNVPHLTLRSRSAVDGEEPKLAHITLTFTGRAYRRH